MNSFLKKERIIIIFFILFINFFFISNAIIKYHFLGSDSLNIASFVEGKRLGEEYFKKDMILSDKRVYNWYTPVYLLFIDFLDNVFHSYYTVYWAQTILFINLYMLGLILLSNRLFKGSFLFKVLFLMVNVVFIRIKMGGGWGIPFKASRPQVFFISLLPFVFYLFLYYIEEKENKIYMFFVFSSLLIYIHPVSAPVFISGFLIIYTILKLKESFSNSTVKNIFSMYVLSFIVILPYFFIYFKRYLITAKSKISTSLLYEIARLRLNKYTFRIPELYQHSFINASFFVKFLFVFSLVSIVYFIVRKKTSKYEIIFLIFYLNLFLFSFCLPVLDQQVSKSMGKFVFEIDFMRNIIFYPFIIYISSFYYLCRIYINLKNRKIKALANVFIIFIVTFFFYNNFLNAKDNKIFQRIKKGNINFSKIYNSSIADKCLVENFTGKGDAVFHFGIATGDIFIRAITKRALVYSYKDGGALLYSGLYDRLIKWYEITKKIKLVRRKIKKSKFQFPEKKIDNKILMLGEKTDADYILISDTKKGFSFENHPKIFCNGHMIITFKKEFVSPMLKSFKTGIYKQGGKYFISLKQLKDKLFFVKIKIFITGKKPYYKVNFIKLSPLSIDGKKYDFSNTVFLKSNKEYILRAVVIVPDDVKTIKNKKIEIINIKEFIKLENIKVYLGDFNEIKKNEPEILVK